MSAIYEWFISRQKASDMTVEVVGLDESPEWDIRGVIVGIGKIVKALARKDGKFFRVVMLRTRAGDREWTQPAIQSTSEEEFHGVILTLVVKMVDGTKKFLVQAKAEPGNKTSGCVALTSTVQASFENIRRNNIPFADLWSDPRRMGAGILQDAGMLYGKVNWIGYVEMSVEEYGGKYGGIIPGNFYLATREEVADIARKGRASEHLLQTMGMMVFSLV